MFSFLALAILMNTLMGCMDHSTMTNPALNINYPASYVVNGGSNTISVIKIADNSVAATITLNGAMFPHHIYLNPAKTKLAVAITSTDLSAGHGAHTGATAGFKIQIIDAITGTIDKEIALTKMPHNAIFNKTGSELWVGQTDDVQSKVIIYSTADWSVKNTVNVGKGLSEITFSPDGNTAFACNTTDNTVSYIDAANKSIHHTLLVGKAPIGAWPSGNGNMYVDNETDQTISEISIAEMDIKSTIKLGFMPGYVAYSDHHGELWVTDATNGKVVYYSKTAGVWTLKGGIPTDKNAHAIAFVADNKTALVTNQDAGNVSIIDIESHKLTKNIMVGTKPNGIALKE